MLWTTLNRAQEAKICIFECLGLNLNVLVPVTILIETPCRINVGAFLRISLQHFIAQKIVPKNLQRLFGLLSKKDSWRQRSPVKGVVALKLAPAVRKSNSDKKERFEKKKRARDKLVIEEVRDKMPDIMIDRLIYLQENVRLWTGV